ncbi:2-oxoglutarate dehydrogenase E1 component [Saitoella coloradoensis]
MPPKGRRQVPSSSTQRQAKKTVSFTEPAPGSVAYDPNDLRSTLQAQGLYAKDVLGDGNCLFRALSDQFYGEVSRYAEIREKCVEYMKANEDDFKCFVGEDEEWEHYVRRMASDGVYGDNLEIVAFARTYDRDVKIYQPGLAYIVSANPSSTPEESAARAKESPANLLHIAYYSWEHYASVRNIAGPHTGPPEIAYKPTGEEKKETKRKAKVDAVKEKIVLASLSHPVGVEAVRRALEDAGGSVALAVEKLQQAEAEKEASGVVGGKEGERNEALVEGAIAAEADAVEEKDGEPVKEGVKPTKPVRSKPIAAPAVKAARMSAAQRKDLAKKKQKEQAKLKRQNEFVNGEDVSKIANAMKTVHI